MKMYKIFNYQAEALQKQTMMGGLKYAPIKDINNDFFITEIEYQHCGLGQEINYIPPTPINIDVL